MRSSWLQHRLSVDIQTRSPEDRSLPMSCGRRLYRVPTMIMLFLVHHYFIYFCQIQKLLFFGLAAAAAAAAAGWVRSCRWIHVINRIWPKSNGYDRNS